MGVNIFYTEANVDQFHSDSGPSILCPLTFWFPGRRTQEANVWPIMSSNIINRNLCESELEIIIGWMDSQGWPTTSPSRGWGGGTLALGSLHILHKVSHSLHTVWTQVWTHVAPGGWQGTLTSCILARTPVNCDTHHLAQSVQLLPIDNNLLVSSRGSTKLQGRPKQG